MPEYANRSRDKGKKAFVRYKLFGKGSALDLEIDDAEGRPARFGEKR
jgi:hypothetical protein